MSEFDDLNQRFAEDGEALALENSGRDGEAAAAAANASTALKAASGLENAVSVASQGPASDTAIETLKSNASD